MNFISKIEKDYLSVKKNRTPGISKRKLSRGLLRLYMIPNLCDKSCCQKEEVLSSVYKVIQ